MSVRYPASAKWRRIHVATAVISAAIAIAALEWSRALAPFAIAAFVYSTRRALLFAQEIELTRTCVICRSRFGEQRISYRQIGRMRFSPLTGDLLLERPWVRVRIPRRYEGRDEIRRAVSLAVWAHRGGDIPPDFAEANTAFG